MRRVLLTTMCFVFYFAGAYSAFADEDCQCGQENYSALLKLARDLPPILALAQASNIEQFCRVTAVRDASDDFKSFEHYSKGDLGTKAYDGDDEIYGWEANFVGSQDFRELNVMQPFRVRDEKLKIEFLRDNQWRENTYAKINKALNENSGAIAPKTKSEFNAAFAEFDKKIPNQSDEIGIGLGQALYVCSDLSILRAGQCAQNLRKGYALVKPVANVALIPIWKEITNDPAYMTVFKRVAQKIIKTLHDRTPPSTHFFDDLKAEFFKASNNEKKADDYAWKTMAILATGGGNAHLRPSIILGHPPSTDEVAKNISELKDLIYVLSNGSTAIDRLTSKNGFLYSFPSGVNNVCDNGKNYHFWLSAYLGRELAKSGGNTGDAARAAFSLEKGYQFASTTEHRDPLKPFRGDAFSTYNNVIRIDLTMAAAGAWFGANAASNSSTRLSKEDIANAIRDTIKGSKPVSNNISVWPGVTNPIATHELYKDWRTIINPDSSFKQFESTQSH